MKNKPEPNSNEMNFGQKPTLQTNFKDWRNFGIKNQSAFIRAMALNGYVLKLDLPELHDAVRLMGSLSNNVNQIVRRLNEHGSIFETEIDDIKDRQKELQTLLSCILHRLDQIQH